MVFVLTSKSRKDPFRDFLYLFIVSSIDNQSKYLFLKNTLGGQPNLYARIQQLNMNLLVRASDRSSYPIFNKRFDHLETLLTIHRPKKVLSAGSLCGPLVPSPQSKCPKRTFMLPQKYHVSVSNMLSKPLKCFMENEN